MTFRISRRCHESRKAILTSRNNRKQDTYHSCDIFRVIECITNPLSVMSGNWVRGQESMNRARAISSLPHAPITSRIVDHRRRRSRTQSTRPLSRGSFEGSRGLTGEPDLIEFRIRAPRRFVIPASNLDASRATLFLPSVSRSYRVFHLRPVGCQGAASITSTRWRHFEISSKRHTHAYFPCASRLNARS